MNAPTKKISQLVVILVTLVPLVAVAYTLGVRHKAMQFLGDIKSIRVGKSSVQDLREMALKYQRFSQSRDLSCNEDSCTLAFYFDNKWLWHLGLAKATRFTGGITAEKGVVTKVNLTLMSDPAYGASVIEVASSDDLSPYESQGRKSTASRGDISQTILLTPSAPQTLREKAYNFDLRCLTKWSGCKYAQGLRPGR